MSASVDNRGGEMNSTARSWAPLILDVIALLTIVSGGLLFAWIIAAVSMFLVARRRNWLFWVTLIVLLICLAPLALYLYTSGSSSSEGGSF